MPSVNIGYSTVRQPDSVHGIFWPEIYFGKNIGFLLEGSNESSVSRKESKQIGEKILFHK